MILSLLTFKTSLNKSIEGPLTAATVKKKATISFNVGKKDS